MTTMPLNVSLWRTGEAPIVATETARRADAVDGAGRADHRAGRELLNPCAGRAVSCPGKPADESEHQALYRRLPKAAGSGPITPITLSQAHAALHTLFTRLNVDGAAAKTIAAKNGSSLPPSAGGGAYVSPFAGLSVEALVGAIAQFISSERAHIQALLIQGLKAAHEAQAGLLDEKVEKYREQMQKALEAREAGRQAEMRNLGWDYFWAAVDIAFGVAELVGAGLLLTNPLGWVVAGAAATSGIAFLLSGITGLSKAGVRTAAFYEEGQGHTEKAEQLRQVADVLEYIELGFGVVGLAAGGVQVGVKVAQKVQKAGSIARAASEAVFDAVEIAQNAVAEVRKAAEAAKQGTKVILEALREVNLEKIRSGIELDKVLKKIEACIKLVNGMKAKAVEAVRQTVRARAQLEKAVTESISAKIEQEEILNKIKSSKKLLNEAEGKVKEAVQQSEIARKKLEGAVKETECMKEELDACKEKFNAYKKKYEGRISEGESQYKKLAEQGKELAGRKLEGAEDGNKLSSFFDSLLKKQGVHNENWKWKNKYKILSEQYESLNVKQTRLAQESKAADKAVKQAKALMKAAVEALASLEEALKTSEKTLADLYVRTVGLAKKSEAVDKAAKQATALVEAAEEALASLKRSWKTSKRTLDDLCAKRLSLAKESKVAKKAACEAAKQVTAAVEIAEKDSTIVKSIMQVLRDQGWGMIAEEWVMEVVQEVITTVGKTERLGGEVARRLVKAELPTLIKRTLTPSRAQAAGAAGYVVGRAAQKVDNGLTARWLANQAFQIKKLGAEIECMQTLQAIQQRCIEMFLRHWKDNGAKLINSQTDLLSSRQLLSRASSATANALAPTYAV